MQSVSYRERYDEYLARRQVCRNIPNEGKRDIILLGQDLSMFCHIFFFAFIFHLSRYCCDPGLHKAVRTLPRLLQRDAQKSERVSRRKAVRGLRDVRLREIQRFQDENEQGNESEILVDI